jgi:hypothetical protein
MIDSTFQRITNWWFPARIPLPGAASDHARSTWPDAVPGLLWNTRPYEDELSVPLMPVPPFAPRRLHDTFDTGILAPPGGVNAAAAARTLTRSALPIVRFALEKPIVEGLGAPVVLLVTSVTEKLTNDGTAIVTVSCAASGALVISHARTHSAAIRAACRTDGPRRLTGGARS